MTARDSRRSTAAYARKKLDGHDAATLTAVMTKLEPKIAAIEARYPTPRAALIPAMHLMQKELQWMSPTAQKAIAKRLGVPPAEVRRVATFYTFFRTEPCGKVIVQICCTLSCELNGGANLMKAAEEFLGIKDGETTSDGKFTLLRVECLGACHKAPVVQFGSADYSEEMTPETLVRALKEFARE